MSAVRRFRKKPMEVEAMQFTGGVECASPIIDWVLAGGGTARYHEHLPAEEFDDGKGHPEEPEHLMIETLEGAMRGDLEDWIIRGVKGEFYPCKPDIFEASYDEVPGPDAPRTLREACRAVYENDEVRARYPDGMDSAMILGEIRRAHPGSFPLVSILDIHDEMSALYGRPGGGR